MKRPRNVLLVALLAAATLWATLWFFGFKAPEGYGTLYIGSVNKDEFLGDGLLDFVEWDSVEDDSGRGKEISGPVEIDGEKGVLWQGWHANGKPWYESRQVNDKQHGKEIRWNAEGQKAEEQHWKSGCLHGPYARWYSNGQLSESATYDTFLLHGVHSTWFRSGQPWTKTEYRRGLREGPLTIWHPNGTKHCEAHFRKDRLHGVWQKWDTEGELVKNVEYRDGAVATDVSGQLAPLDAALMFAQGSGWHGFNTLRISTSGRCEVSYFLESYHVDRAGEKYRKQLWRKAAFTLTQPMAREVKKAVDAADLFSLEDNYINHDIADGTQWVLGLRSAGKEKFIYCSNKFPDAVRTLSVALRTQLLVPHRVELLTATRIEKGERDPRQAPWLE